MDLLELIILGLIKLFSQPQNPQQQRTQANQMEAVRQRMAAARQQQDSDVLVARMPPPVRQATQPSPQNAARLTGQQIGRATAQQKRPKRAAGRAMPPPVPRIAPVAKTPPAPPPIARAKPAVAIHHTGIETSTRWLSRASLRSAIVASEILQPPLSLRE